MFMSASIMMYIYIYIEFVHVYTDMHVQVLFYVQCTHNVYMTHMYRVAVVDLYDLWLGGLA